MSFVYVNVCVKVDVGVCAIPVAATLIIELRRHDCSSERRQNIAILPVTDGELALTVAVSMSPWTWCRWWCERRYHVSCASVGECFVFLLECNLLMLQGCEYLGLTVPGCGRPAERSSLPVLS